MSAQPLRVAVCGLVHDHIWGNLRHFAACDGAEVIAAADPNQPLLDKVKADAGIERTYLDYLEMLDAEQPDAALCYTENSRHAEVVEACAERGVHVMCEKPMADRLANAERMVAAAQKHGIKLMINYPTTWNPALQYAKRLIDEGKIGQVCQMRMHCAHAGPKELGCSEYFYSWLYDAEKNGAGAFMDYCCYGANINAWILGLPNSVVATRARLYKDYIDVDDNAFILMEYDGAYGIAEASWTQIGKQPMGGPTINGSQGTLVVMPEGLLVITKDDPEGRVVEPPQPPRHWRTPAEHFVWAIVNDEEPQGPNSMHVCRDAQEILEAGLLASDSGRRTALPLA
ncbi:MAG: Gfo/Idh/MocA family protein [Armatimonadota bacterium]